MKKKGTKPTKQDKQRGLYAKYRVSHADGTPCDPDAEYFVLRLDYHDGCDNAHVACCRMAIRFYGWMIAKFLPRLSKDIVKRYGL